MRHLDFTLEQWRIEYAASVAKYANNHKVAESLRTGFPQPYTLKDAEEYIARTTDIDPKSGYCRAIVVDGEAVGSIGVFFGDGEQCKCGELGYWLGEPFWGRRIARSAVRQICKEVFSKYSIERIYAEPYSHNTASRKVLNYSGFTLEGVMRRDVYRRDGSFYDSCMYALLRDDFFLE